MKHQEGGVVLGGPPRGFPLGVGRRPINNRGRGPGKCQLRTIEHAEESRRQQRGDRAVERQHRCTIAEPTRGEVVLRSASCQETACPTLSLAKAGLPAVALAKAGQAASASRPAELQNNAVSRCSSENFGMLSASNSSQLVNSSGSTGRRSLRRSLVMCAGRSAESR